MYPTTAILTILFLGLVLFRPIQVLAEAPAVSLEDQWDVLLKEHTIEDEADGISTVLVDYGALAKDPLWPVLLDSLASATVPQEHDAKLAFYVNAYNILAIKTVLSEHPVDSIKDVGNLLKPVWRKDAGDVAGEIVSLDQIEHEIIRPMGDARIHAAIVCAAVSCPDLRREAYRAERADAQLEEQMRAFLANEQKGARLENSELRVSSIFKWFIEDFEKESGSLKAFLKEYLPEQASTTVSAETNITFLDYDWKLNDVRFADSDENAP